MVRVLRTTNEHQSVGGYTASRSCYLNDVFIRLFLWCLAVWGSLWPHVATADGVTVSLLDVGLGEAVLIACPGGSEFTLIDAGDRSAQYPGASEKLREGLQQRMGRNRTFTQTINTHPHPDHVAGFQVLFESGFSTAAHYDDGADFPAEQFEEQLRRSLGGRYRGIPPPRLKLCPADSPELVLEQLLLTPDERRTLGCPGELNACSLKFRLQVGKSSILLAADGTVAWEEVALASPILRKQLPATVLKVGHHGSSAATSARFLEAVHPEYLGVSSGVPEIGRMEELGYPSFSTLDRIGRYLSRRFPADLEKRSVRGCERLDGVCQWREVQLSERVRATFQDGSIDLHLLPDRVEIVRR